MSNTHKPKVGVAFTGSGLYGIANIALIELFEEQHYVPDIIIGSGSGAAIAGLWGQGLSSQEIIRCVEHSTTENMLKKIDLYSFLSFFITFGQYKKEHAILKTTTVQRLYKKLFKQTKLEELCPKTLIQTTCVETGMGTVFDAGLLSDLVYASGAILPFFPPIHIGSHWYADGSFSAPVPALELVNRGIDHIVSFSFAGHGVEQPKTFLSYYSNFINMAFSKSQRVEIALAIDMHQGEILLLPAKIPMGKDIFDANEIGHILAVGRETVHKHRDAIMRLIT